MNRLYKINWLAALLFFSLFFRLFRISTPSTYVFDEVYHVISIKAIAKNLPQAYDPFAHSPEPNTAYDWLHPPLAKLIQAFSIKLLGEHSFAWRLPSAIFGTLSIAALYYLALVITQSRFTALTAATIFSLDGLQLTMSRIAMNDIFVTTFILLSLAFFYQTLNHFSDRFFSRYCFLTGLFTGLALASKWSALLLYPLFAIFLSLALIKLKSSSLSKLASIIFASFVFLFLLPLLIYLFSYTQFFFQGNNWQQFINLQRQIYIYQTTLKASHDYQSTALQWPLLIRPVWFYVNYLPSKTAYIYNLGNPVVFWGGLSALVFLFFQTSHFLLKKFSQQFLLVSYLSLFFPFVFSPRIMFLHHYLPALALLCLLIATVISGSKSLTIKYLILVFLVFIFFYPLNTAIPISKPLIHYYFWLPTWR